MARQFRYGILAFAAVMMVAWGPGTQSAEAQYFGRNQVQYKTFDFDILETEHFDIFFYPEEAEAAKEAGIMAERWYSRISRLLNHKLRARFIPPSSWVVSFT